MRRLTGFLCLLVMLATSPVFAQNNRELNEQLASKCFQDKEYEKAKELYLQLYKDKSQANYFNQYLECLLRLGDYDNAERELKKFIRNNPNNWKSKVDLVYVYSNSGQNDKANDILKEILKGIPNNKNSINNISSMFRSRMLYNDALAVLEKGAENNNEDYPFYVERASLYHSMNNYQQAFEYYFLELEARPNQYNLVKNRFQTLLLYDVNKSIADEMRIALLQKTQEHPDNVEFAQLLIWFSLQEEDYDIALEQCKSIDRRLNDQDGQIINLANICLDNHQYEVAKDAFDYVIDKGKINPYYGQAIIGSIRTENQLCKDHHVTDIKTYEKLSKKIENAYSDVSSKEYPSLVEIQADIMAYQLNQSDQAISLLMQAIEQTNAKLQQCQLKLKLADIYLYNDEVWEATLLYSQVDKSMKEEPLGHEARFRNAQLRYFIGEFAWAETQLNVLKAATSKLIANDAMTLSLIIGDNLEYDTTGIELSRLARADFKIYQHKDDDALVILDSIAHDGNEISKPHAMYRTAEIMEQRKEYSEADSLYQRIFTEFPESYMADAALMQAALIEHNNLKDRALAKKHYEKLIDEYPTSLYSAQAKKNYRKL
jgi:tetratricopeptide (TPR) repeat protein